MFTITPKANVARVNLQLKNTVPLVRNAIRKAFYDIGKDLVASTKEEINKKPKHGAIYLKTHGLRGELKKPRYYTASAPGEAPAVVTGQLRKSINFTVNGYNEMIFGVDLSRGKAPYGKYLEYSNLTALSVIRLAGVFHDKNRVSPRPFISAAYKKNKSNIKRKFANAINQAIKK